MKFSSNLAVLLPLSAALFVLSCDPAGWMGDPIGGGDPPTSNENDNGTPTNGNSNVNDNTGEDPGTGTPRPRPGAGTAARVRNESAFRADVTLRFIEEDTVAHLAFVRVLPLSTTTVTGPTVAEILEFTGSSANGSALPPATLYFGEDFGDDEPAEYVIPANPGGGGEPPEPPSITLLEPASDITVALGGVLTARWTDDVPTLGTIVRIGFRPADDVTATIVFLGPAVGAALDGPNDELDVIVEAMDPGVYAVVAQIDDGSTVVQATAPGRVEIVNAGDNVAPSITILAPLDMVSAFNGESVDIEWEDDDPDDNATVEFSLENADPSVVGIGPYTISPPLAEDADGAGDRYVALIDGVLPGVYDLVAHIDDGDLSGTDRAVRVVRVLADPENDIPSLTLVEPTADVDIMPGGSFTVRWVDSDENDNASISLYLDPDEALARLDGDEFLLVSTLQEDPDGAGDRITLGVPTGVPQGIYRIAGKISDGVAEVVAWAPGRLLFGVSSAGQPELSLNEPAADVRTRLGESIDVFVHAVNLPFGASPRLFLSNEAFGGTVRVEITPPSLTFNAPIALEIPTGLGAIPNSAWPRSFELIAEVLIDSVPNTAKAAGVIWVRQEVQIVHSELVNCDCETGTLPTDPRAFIGFNITYFGGGFTERDLRQPVEFWLTADGEIPLTGVDVFHGILGYAEESPRLTHNVNFPINRIVTPRVPGQQLQLLIRAGIYQIVPVVRSAEFGLMVSPPAPQTVDVCLCLSDN